MAQTPYPKVAILIAGKARAGKDTVATILARTVRGKLISLATPLYTYASDITGMSIGELHDPKVKESIRPFLQELGTLTRTHFPVSPFMSKVVRQVVDSEDLIVIPDIRYQSDIDACKVLVNYGWEVVLLGVFRKDIPNTINMSENHDSEDFANNLENYDSLDYTINNDGTIKQLEELVNKFLVEYLDKRLVNSRNRDNQYKPLLGSDYQTVTKINTVTSYLDMLPRDN